jgi:hypothetical protein
MLRKNFPLVVLTLGVLLQTSPVPLRAWTLGPAGLIPTSISTGSVLVIPVTQADFNSDGAPENLSVADGKATIVSGSRIVWQSSQAWTVIQAAITDLNRDNMPEAALLVWRPFRPWPVDQWLPHGGRIANFHDAGGYSCHIILVGWRRGGYQEMWAGSALAEPVKSFSVADLNGDGHQELVTLEGTYTDPRSAPARALKVWEWNGFGFTVVSHIEGVFGKMSLIRADDGRILVLVP